MKSPFRKALGILIALASAASLLLSLFLISQTWLWSHTITQRLLIVSDHVSETLSNTSQTLEWLKGMNVEISQTVSTTQSALLTMAQSAHETTILLDSLIILTGETLPEFIATTQTSIESAKDTAQLIDGIMNAISRIPFLGQTYSPEQSLSASLSRISADLDQFSPQLKTMQTDLKKSQANLKIMEEQVMRFAYSLQTTQDELNQSSQLMDHYAQQITQLQVELNPFKRHLPGWVKTLAWGITFFMSWLAGLQGYVCYKSIQLLITA